MTASGQNYYGVLQVDPSAHPDVMDAAYRRLALLYHPDKDSSPEAHARMKRLNEAWAVLKDPSARKAYDAKLGLNGNSTTKDHPSNTRGGAEESPARARPSAAPNRDVSKRRVSADDLLNQWYEQLSWIRRRFFLPKDFLANVRAIEGDAAVCHKTTVDTLHMQDTAVREHLKLSESNKYKSDSDYRPQTFKKETLKIFSERRKIDCTGCFGSEFLTCRACSGKGSVYCPRQMPCPSCCGRNRLEVGCEECLGMGCPSCGGRGSYSRRCRECSRDGRVRCNRCYGEGSRKCNACRGNGRVECERCKGTGRLVDAVVLIRRFSTDREVTLKVAPNQFRNGLKDKHFNGLEGTLEEDSCVELKPPVGGGIVRQRRNVQSYDLLSYHFSHKGKPFHVNRIVSDKGLKYVTSKVPRTLRLRS